MTRIDLSLDPHDRRLRGVLSAGIVQAAGVAVEPARPPLLAEFAQVEDDLRRRHAGSAPAEIRGLQAARELYRAFGIDPTKTRPSSESLLRRVLKSKPMPRVSNAVDLCNLLALRFLLPIGLYDVARIQGPVLIRRGLAGESYAGIRKADVHLEGRPLLADALGAFGNPTSDSARTAVGSHTTELLLVVFAPGSVDPAMLAEHARGAAQSMRRHLQRENAPEAMAWTMESAGKAQ